MGTTSTGLQQLGIEGMLNDVLVRKLNASVRAIDPYLRREGRLSRPSPVMILEVAEA